MSDIAGPFTGFTLFYEDEEETVVAIPIATTPAPTIDCTPQSQVGNGGKGKSGCNPGGVGWTRTYTGAIGGVPAHADPTDGETLTGKSAVDIWVELDVLSYATSTVTTHRRSFEELGDLNTYYGGRKQAALLAIGALEHGLGNEQGTFEAASADIDFSDAIDRLFRNLLATEDLDGNEVRIYAASPTARAAGSAPRLLFRGVVQRTTLAQTQTVRLTAVDILFADGGPFGPDRQWPPLIPKTIFPTAPPESWQLAMPVLYGEKSDEGATDPATGEAISKGLCPLIFVGSMTVSGSPEPGVPIQDLSIPAPEIHAITNLYASGGIDGFNDTTYNFLAAKRVSDGVIGTLAGPWTLNPSGQEQEDGTYNYIHFSFLNDEPNPAYLYVAWASTDPTFHPITNPNVGQRGSAVHDGETRDSYYEHEDRDASVLVKPVETPDSNVWDAYLVTLGASYQIISLYGSDLGGGIEENQHDRVLIDADARGGSDVLGPDWPGWPFANRYVDYTGPDGVTFRCTMIFARGPMSDDHKNGVVTMACNMVGIEDVGDGTGLPILQAHDAQQHWLENFILGQYTSGLWVTNSTAPKWADGTYKVRSSRFAARQAVTVTALGGNGLLVGWYVGAQAGALDYVGQWNRDTETQLGSNGHGQLTLGWADPTAAVTAYRRIDHVTDIFGPITTQFSDQRENMVVGSCDWDPDFDKFRAGPLEFKSREGYLKFKSRWKQGHALDSKILSDTTHLTWVLQQRLDRLKVGEIPVEITGHLGLLDTDVDTPGILLTTIEGTGSLGYVDRAMTLRRRRLDLQSRLVTYSLVDLRRSLTDSVFFPAAGSLSLTGQTPSLSVTGVAVGRLVLTGTVPVIKLTMPVAQASLTFTGQAPTVVVV